MVDAECTELEHCKLELEIDSAHLVDVKFRGYKLEAMGSALAPKSLLVASWSGKLTKSSLHASVKEGDKIQIEAHNLCLNGAVVAGVIVFELGEKSVKRLT
jgi:hypothetical protein